MNRLTLDEASGPVSPRFQYSFAITIEERDDDEVSVTVRSKKGSLGTHDLTAEASREAFRALLATINGAAPVDLVDDARAARVGVRVSSLVLTRDEETRTIRYTASDVDERVTPDERTKALRAARRAILEFVRPLLPA